MQNKLELIKTCNTEDVIQKHYSGYGYEVEIKACIFQENPFSPQG